MPKSKTDPATWPKLSETLPRRDPGHCQECGSELRLTYWQECDDRDQGMPVFVILCQGCSDRIIEPHPRLYRDLAANTPMPGVMSICADCRERDGLRCTSAAAKINGGPGLKYEPEGSMVHLCRSPRRLSGWQYLMPGPVTKCSGKRP